MSSHVTIQERLEEVVAQVGPWSAHNLKLAEGVFTRGEPTPNPRLRQITQIVTDVVGKSDLTGVRVADLGSLEGLFAIELALRGAEVVGIEGRESNNTRARFAADVLGLKRCTFEKADVRDFSVDRFGSFDVVLCLGLLYHLDGDGVFDLIENIRQATRRALVLDTHISLRGGMKHSRAGKHYEGHWYAEHRPAASDAEVEAKEWASLDNLRSFWPTRGALFDALVDGGFTSLLECHVPQSDLAVPDRIQVVAYAGTPADCRTVPSPPAEIPPFVPHAPPPRYDLRAVRKASRAVRGVRRR